MRAIWPLVYAAPAMGRTATVNSRSFRDWRARARKYLVAQLKNFRGETRGDPMRSPI